LYAVTAIPSFLAFTASGMINSLARGSHRTVLPSFGIIMKHVASSAVNLCIQLDWRSLRPVLTAHRQSPYRTRGADWWCKRSGPGGRVIGL